MTLIEFLAPISGLPNRDKILAAMYFLRVRLDIATVTIQTLREHLTLARVRGARTMNISDVLAKAGPSVTRVAPSSAGGASGWRLTDTGAKRVRELVGEPEVAVANTREIATLDALTARIGDDVVRGYVHEAITCLGADARRAAVVFVWTGAIRHLEEAALAVNTGRDVTDALRRHDPKSRSVGRVSDFANTKDSVELLAFRELGMLDKGQWQTLKEALDLRNLCGHPTKYRPGAAKVASFIEDVVGIVFA